MAGREKGLISSRHILIYAVNLIRQRGSLCNASFHSSKLPRKAGSRRIDTRSWRVYVYEKRACLGQVAQLEFAASWFFRIACKWITRESLKQMPWRINDEPALLDRPIFFSTRATPSQGVHLINGRPFLSPRLLTALLHVTCVYGWGYTAFEGSIPTIRAGKWTVKAQVPLVLSLRSLSFMQTRRGPNMHRVCNSPSPCTSILEFNRCRDV